MNFLNKLLEKNSPLSFLIKFLLCFFALYYFYPFYRGVTGEGGRIYSSFLDHHLNLVWGLTSFLTGAARLILAAFHYNVTQSNYHTLRIEYSRGISVNPSCLGWAVMSFWAAFVFANQGTWQRKLKWIAGGIASIVTLNIIRIVLICIANHLNWRLITSLDAHDTFNVFSYGCIFLLMFWFARSQKKYEGIKVAGGEQSLRTVDSC